MPRSRTPCFPQGRKRMIAIAATVVVLAGIGGWGARRVADGSLTREGTPLRVGLIQGNIAQEDKWNPGRGKAHLHDVTSP